MAGAMRGGMEAGVGRSFSMAAMTASTTSAWFRSLCFLLVTSQKFSLSRLVASMSSSWQHTGMAESAKALDGASRMACE